MRLSTPINQTESGELIAAPGAGWRIRVLGFLVMSDTADAAPQFYSSAGTGADDELTGPLPVSENGGASVPATDVGCFDCGEDEALYLRQALSAQLSGFVRWDKERVIGA